MTLSPQVRKSGGGGYRCGCRTKETKHLTEPGESFVSVCVCACHFEQVALI